MPALASAAFPDDFRAQPATRHVQLLIAGHTGQIGSELCRLLHAQERHLQARRIRLQVAGRFNRSEFLWDEPGSGVTERFTRDACDWPQILRRFLGATHGPRVFVDCTAGKVFSEHYPELLRHGIGIVTPNKLANSASQASYTELHTLACQYHTPFCYETSVGAALPVLGPIADLVCAGDLVKRIEALLSGTLSFIFRRVNNGERFSMAVREARARGYTEPHPAADLAGADSGRKLLILLREAGLSWEPEQVQVESLVPPELAAEKDPERFLSGLVAQDAAWAERAEAAHRRSLRLVYLARFDGCSANVGITHVANDDPFALLAPGENLIRIWTDRYHPVPLSIAGPGAGPELTAAGVFTDIFKAAHELLSK